MLSIRSSIAKRFFSGSTMERNPSACILCAFMTFQSEPQREIIQRESAIDSRSFRFPTVFKTRKAFHKFSEDTPEELLLLHRINLSILHRRPPQWDFYRQKQFSFSKSVKPFRRAFCILKSGGGVLSKRNTFLKVIYRNGSH